MKRNKLLICKIHTCNMDESQMYFVNQRSQTLKLTYYMVLFIRHSGKGKTIWIGSCQRMGGAGVGGQWWLTRGILRVRELLCTALGWDIHNPMHSSKSIQPSIKKKKL